ncbi:MAG: hypothetical protein ABS81_04020 [Pseudonocardia sp. SCN 72-86]|uniref:hypothetical protein n=1 Tax=uncultured Microbacterium sp. TaxID=191216 RepID=UPI00086C6278|nr:hypothetical protein [uncultured Microbacterium sp.]ODU06786.1 MAG: hypothetical protein ABS81_04020 [Pseudonocardia sp. SCN 72-86]
MKRKLGFGERETIDAMLAASKRPSEMVQIRNAFVQKGKKGKPSPGALAAMVAKHDRSGLDLFLLHRMMASAEPWDAGKEAGVWARALGLAVSDTEMHAERVSRIFRRLDETYNLVSRDTARRGGKVTSLLEDGTREPYTSPNKRYFRLPFAYWQDDFHRRLSMPSKAVLLIGLTQEPGFVVPPSQVKNWYGISDDTWATGVRELEDEKVMTSKRGKERNWMKGLAYNYDLEYTLLPPFDTRTQPGFKGGR